MRVLLFWAAVLASLSGGGGEAAGEGSPHTEVALSALTAAPGRVLEADTLLVWAGEGVAEAGIGRLEIDLDRLVVGRTLVFNLIARSPITQGAAPMGVRLETAGGETLARAALDVRIAAGANPFQVTWPAEAVAGVEPGQYRLVVETRETRGGVYTRTWPIELWSAGALWSRHARLAERLDELGRHVAAISAADRDTQFQQAQLALAAAELERGAAALSREAWREGEARLTTAQAKLHGVAVDLTFVEPPETWGASPPPDAALRLDERGVTRGGRPAYLFGFHFPRYSEAACRAMAEVGLDFISFDMSGPAETDAFAALARETGMGAVGVTSLADSVPSARIVRGTDSGERVSADVTKPHVRADIARDAGQSLDAGVRGLLAAALGRRVSVQIPAPVIRPGLTDYALEQYGERYFINRAWGMRLRDLSGIPVDWSIERSAYRYDLRTYHQRLGTGFLARLHRRTAAGVDVPLGLGLDMAFFGGDEVRGVDRLELLLATEGPVMAFRERAPAATGLALNPAAFAGSYQLAHDVSGGRPLLALRDASTAFEAVEGAHARRYLATACWLAVLAGVDGLAFPLPGDDLLSSHSGHMEGLARASYDINRLAPLVRLFEQQRPPVAIFWSEAAAMLEDNEAFLGSTQAALTACMAFGYGARFVTAGDLAQGTLSEADLLVLPKNALAEDAAFEAVREFISAGGIVLRPEDPMSHTERGASRPAGLPFSDRTVLVRGQGTASDYLHALDAAFAFGEMFPIPRPVNSRGYPLEGVYSRFMGWGGRAYVFLVNLRAEPVVCHVWGGAARGRDVLSGRSMELPSALLPLDPVLLELGGASGASAGFAPGAVLSPPDAG